MRALRGYRNQPFCCSQSCKIPSYSNYDKLSRVRHLTALRRHNKRHFKCEDFYSSLSPEKT